jgi:hypothetical protein
LPKNRRDLEKLPLKRRDENPIKDVEIEEEIIFHLPLERAECQGKWNEESAKFGERAMRKTRAVATLPEIENATAEFRTKCFGVRCVFASLSLGWFRNHAELIRATLLKSNLKSLKITCAAFLPGAIDTPGPG